MWLNVIGGREKISILQTEDEWHEIYMHWILEHFEPILEENLDLKLV